MAKFKELPILLVSTGDKAAADYITSELVDKEATDIEREEGDVDVVWRIENKYYTADVRVLVRLDGAAVPDTLLHLIEGHLIYLTPHECSAEVLERRAADVRCAVRVVATQHAVPHHAAPHSAALALRAELVPLQPPEEDGEEEEEDEERGVARVRAALHAHTWRGLTLLHPRLAPPPRAESESDGEGGEDEEEEEEEWVWGSVRRGSLSEPREERVARAEGLLRALRLI